MSRQIQWNRQLKNRLFYALAMVALLSFISGSLAWYAHTQRVQTATLINMPKIYIEGPDGSVIDLIELGDIDVTNGTGREYVFRIVTAQGNNYRLQLAHTTNIPFTYTIYPVSESQTEYSVLDTGETYYYDMANPLGGEYLEKSDTHDITYAPSTNTVQSDAEPKYWQSVPIMQNGNYTYYVLRISWNEGLKNNKETDMVYLTVKLVKKQQ